MPGNTKLLLFTLPSNQFLSQSGMEHVSAGKTWGKATLATEQGSWECSSRQGEGGRSYYDGFAFRDRMTRHRFQYREARDRTDLRGDFLEWTATDSPASRELKTSLNVYKFTKDFEINCIRSKYLRGSHQPPATLTPTARPSQPTRPTPKALFTINKQELQRMVREGGHVSSEVLRLNSCSNCPPVRVAFKSGRRGVRWGIENREEQVSLESGEAERRITEKIVNHMKHEIRTNCEYLLPMDVPQRKKALFNTQLRRHRQARKTVLPNRHCRTELDECRFSPLPVQEVPEERPLERREDEGEERRVMELARRGYLHELGLVLEENERLCGSRDAAGNNILHVAAKQGSADRAAHFLRLLPPRYALSLLAQTNHLKRTPTQKAVLLNHTEVVAVFEEFVKEHREII